MSTVEVPRATRSSWRWPPASAVWRALLVLSIGTGLALVGDEADLGGASTASALNLRASLAPDVLSRTDLPLASSVVVMERSLGSGTDGLGEAASLGLFGLGLWMTSGLVRGLRRHRASDPETGPGDARHRQDGAERKSRRTEPTVASSRAAS